MHRLFVRGAQRMLWQPPLCVPAAPVRWVINLSLVSVLPLQKFLRVHVLFPEQPESCITHHK